MDSVGELLQLIEQLSTTAASGEQVDLGRFRRLSSLYFEAGKKTARSKHVPRVSYVSDEQLAQSFRVLQASLTQSVDAHPTAVVGSAEEHVPQLLVQVNKLVVLAQEGVHADVALPLLLTMDLMAVLFAQRQSMLQAAQRSADERVHQQRSLDEAEMLKSVSAANKRAEELQEALSKSKAQYSQLEKLYREQCDRSMDLSADLTAAQQNVQGLQRAIDTHLSTIATLAEQLQLATAQMPSTTVSKAVQGKRQEGAETEGKDAEQQMWADAVRLAEAKLEAVTDELHDQMALNEQLCTEVLALKQERADQSNNLTEKEKELAAMTKQLAEAAAEHAHEKSCLEARIRKLKLELAAQHGKSAQQLQQRSTTTTVAELRDLRLEVQELRTAAAQQRVKLDEQTGVLEDLRQQVDTLQTERTALLSTLKERDKELSAAHDSLDQAQQEVERLEDALSASLENTAQMADILAASQELQSQERETEFQRQIQEQEERLLHLQTKYDQGMSQVGQLRLELADRDAKLRETNEGIAEKQAEIDCLQGQLEAQAFEASQLEDVKAERQQQARRVQELEDALRPLLEVKDQEVQQLQKERNEASSRADQLQASLADREAELRVAKEAASTAQSELRRLQQELQGLKEGLLAAETDKEQQETRMHELEAQLQQRTAEAENMRHAQEAALRSVQAQRAAASERSEALEKEVATLTLQLNTWTQQALVAVNGCATENGGSELGDAEHDESSENDVEYDVESDDVPRTLLFVEMGAYQIRAAVCSTTGLEAVRSYHTIQAVPVQGKEAVELVASASIKADKMFQFFREHGRFIGNHAWHCCFEHPDPALRGSIRMEPLICDREVQDQEAFVQLLQQVLGDSADGALVIVALHAGVSAKHRSFVLEAMFEHLYVSHCSLLSQPSLALAGLSLATGVHVNIGAETTTAVAVYEGFVIGDSLQISHIGGETITRFMVLVMSAKYLENYTYLLARRQEYIARLIKERSCFVAEDFSEAVRTYGSIVFEAKETLLVQQQQQQQQQSQYPELEDGGETSAPEHTGVVPRKPEIEEAATNEHLKAIQVEFEETLPDGSDIKVLIDRERFYCPELLFQPDLFEECKDQTGLIHLIQTCVASIDASCRDEVSEHIVLSGGSSRLPRLLERVQSSLGSAHKVHCAEDDSFPSAVCRGMEQRVRQLAHSSEHGSGNILKQLENVVSYDDFNTQGVAVLENLM